MQTAAKASPFFQFEYINHPTFNKPEYLFVNPPKGNIVDIVKLNVSWNSAGLKNHKLQLANLSLRQLHTNPIRETLWPFDAVIVNGLVLAPLSPFGSCFECVFVVAGYCPDGGAFVGDYHPLLSRKLPPVRWWRAGLHPAPVSWAGERLSGQVPKRPGDFHVLCWAAGKTGEAASWGEDTATWCVYVGKNAIHACQHYSI